MEIEKGRQRNGAVADARGSKPIQMHQCDARNACFDTAQALGGHRCNFMVAKAACADHERVELAKNTIVDYFAIVAVGKREQNVNVKPKVIGATLLVSDT